MLGKRLRPRNAALTGGLLALAELEIWLDVWTTVPDGRELLVALLAALAVLPLAWRRRFPLAVLVAVLGSYVAFAFLLGAPVAGVWAVVAWLLAVYSAAAQERFARSVAALGITAALTALTMVPEPPRAVEEFLALVLFAVAVPWLAGVVRGRNRRAATLADLASRLEREREENAEAAVVEERARIARELHDVIAHGVGLMVVQAEAGEALLAREPERAREAFRSIESAGRDALTELRRLLGILRETEARPLLGPQPSIAEVDRLVEQLGEAGLHVELRVEGEATPLPQSLELSAFRILQEGLTNVLKHAGSAHAEVTLRYARDALEIGVVDDGRGTPNGSDGGYGLAGLRERVALYGGALEAGPRPEGGYTLRARLPLATL